MPKRPQKKSTTKPEVDVKLLEVSKTIQVVLESNGFALQPFIAYSEYGITPRVRLVRVPQSTNDNPTNTTTDENGTNQGDTAEATEPDATAEAS